MMSRVQPSSYCFGNWKIDAITGKSSKGSAVFTLKKGLKFT